MALAAGPAVEAVEQSVRGAAEMALETPACCSFCVLLLHDPELPIDGFPSSALKRLGPGIVPCEGLRNERGARRQAQG